MHGKNKTTWTITLLSILVFNLSGNTDSTGDSVAVVPTMNSRWLLTFAPSSFLGSDGFVEYSIDRKMCDSIPGWDPNSAVSNTLPISLEMAISACGEDIASRYGVDKRNLRLQSVEFRRIRESPKNHWYFFVMYDVNLSARTVLLNPAHCKTMYSVVLMDGSVIPPQSSELAVWVKTIVDDMQNHNRVTHTAGILDDANSSASVSENCEVVSHGTVADNHCIQLDDFKISADSCHFLPEWEPCSDVVDPIPVPLERIIAAGLHDVVSRNNLRPDVVTLDTVSFQRMPKSVTNSWYFMLRFHANLTAKPFLTDVSECKELTSLILMDGSSVLH